MIGRKWKIFYQIFNNMPESMYFVSADRRIQYWNKAAESMTGLSSDEIVGRSLEEINIKYEDEEGNSIEPSEYPAALCFQKGKVIRNNFLLKTENNKNIAVEETASPLFDGDKMTGVITAIKDNSTCIERVTRRVREEKKDRLIPICGWCKKIRKEDDSWEKLEDFLVKDGIGVFTHGMCESCSDTIFEKKIYLESYQNICKAISASISLDEVLQLIVANVVKVMNVKASLLRLLNKETQQLEVAAYYGLSEKYANKGPVAYDASIDDALAGKSVSTYDMTEHEDSKYYEEAMEEGIRSILSIPLRADKEVIGVLRMYTAEPVDYTDEDLKFISALAEQGAVAIVNAKHFEKEISKEKEYLRVFEEITKAVSSTLDIGEMLNLIVRKIPEVMGLKGSSLRLLDEGRKQLELVSYYGLSEKYANKGPVSYDASIDDAMAGKPVSVYDITEHKDSEYYKEAVEEGIMNIVSVPMRYQNKLIGILRLYTTEPPRCKEDDQKFLIAIAEQTAIAIVNAKRFVTEISKEREYLRVFEEITKVVSSTLDVKEVLDLIVEKIPEVMNLKAATVRLLDNAGAKLKIAAAYGLSEKYLNKGPVDAEKNVTEALKEKPVAIYDVPTDDRIRYKDEAREEGIKSMLTIPVIARGKVLGILRLLTGEPRKFSRQEIDFAASLAEVCGIAIANATMYEKTKKDYDKIMNDIDGAVFEKK